MTDINDFFEIVERSGDAPPAGAHGIIFHYHDPTAQVCIKADRPDVVIRPFMFYNKIQPIQHRFCIPMDETMGCYFFILNVDNVNYGTVPSGIRVSVGTENIPFKYIVAKNDVPDDQEVQEVQDEN
jgi:hypothetical protein